MSGQVDLEALHWLARISDPAFEDWDAWQAWLAQSEAHAKAYWRLAQRDAVVDEVVAQAHEVSPRAGVSRPPSGRRWRGGFIAAAGAVAACLVAIVGLQWPREPATWIVQTAAGEQRQLALADGSVVELDASTRITLDRRDLRRVRLDAGRIRSHVVHDARTPFTVVVGNATVVDLGTVFEVTRYSAGARVAVSEGSVRFASGGRSETLTEGQALTMLGGELRRGVVNVDAEHDFRDGRFTYSDETLAIIAQDIGRTFGVQVDADPVIAARRFSGSISVRGSAGEVRPRLEALLGVRIVNSSGGWRLEPAPA